MASRDHYVSQFHLRGFTDPRVTKAQEPWLWVADCDTGSIARRAPKNVAWARGLFAGAGGLVDRQKTIEAFLASAVESPAAVALRGFAARATGQRGPIPAELGRYLAWAAARSLPMVALFQEWVDEAAAAEGERYAESPPNGFEKITAISRMHRMVHPQFGAREDVPSEDVEHLRTQGWRLVLQSHDFLELAHLQAWYFQIRFFPRLQWVVVEAPPGWHFIVADRPIVWGFDGQLNVPPRALRHPDVQLFCALTRSIALFAYHGSGLPPREITCEGINRVLARGAKQWIAGPTRETVGRALELRES